MKGMSRKREKVKCGFASFGIDRKKALPSVVKEGVVETGNRGRN